MKGISNLVKGERRSCIEHCIVHDQSPFDDDESHSKTKYWSGNLHNQETLCNGIEIPETSSRTPIESNGAMGRSFQNDTHLLVDIGFAQ